MRLAGMIWDLDGTLADTLPVCIAAIRHALAVPTGRRYSDAEIATLFGVTEAGMIRRVVPDAWREAERVFLAEYERLHDSALTVFPGIEETLRALRGRGIRLAIVTGKGQESAGISVRHLGLAPYFEHVEVGSPDAPIKPHSIRLILDAWDMAPADCAYVGDTPYDMVAAAEVGLIPLGAAWATTATVSKNTLPHPAAVFKRVEEVLRWLDCDE
jgi:HAD superfamily hydrolase (TIGR01549 family)